MNLKNKKGVSPVIATVLTILLVFVAFGVVYQVVIPMVREGLEGGTNCFDLMEHAVIKSSDYTCYVTDEDTGVSVSKTMIMIERGFEEQDIEGFVVSIKSEGSSKRYEINSDETFSEATISSLSDAGFPGPAEATTYIFENTAGDKADLGIMLKGGEICEMGSYNIPKCFCDDIPSCISAIV